MERAQKHELVSSLNQVFADVPVVVVAHYSGLTVKEITNLRGQMRAAGASFKVAKNRLVRLAIAGTPASSIEDLLKGPTGIAYSSDPVAAAKVAVQFAKTNDKFIILGGVISGQRIDLNGVKALAELPSLDVLRGKLIGLIQAPATKIAGVVQAPAGQLARLLNAHATKDAA